MKPMTTPPLPTHWSPEQALAVFEYVQQLSEQIWWHYHSDIMSLLGEDVATDIRQLPDDSLPQALFDDHDDKRDTSNLPF